MLYSWEGAKKKKVFKTLNIAAVILGKSHKLNRNCDLISKKILIVEKYILLIFFFIYSLRRRS